MRLVLRLVLNLVLRLVLVAVLATIAFGPTLAEDSGTGEIQIDTRLVCSTQHETFRFVKLYSGDAEGALRIVNAEESDPTACDISRASSWKCEDRKYNI